MEKITPAEFTATRSLQSRRLLAFGDHAASLHWTDSPYHWHVNHGDELFVVLDGAIDMHVRDDDGEHAIRLEQGDILCIHAGEAHVAHPCRPSRVLVVERVGSE